MYCFHIFNYEHFRFCVAMNKVLHSLEMRQQGHMLNIFCILLQLFELLRYLLTILARENVVQCNVCTVSTVHICICKKKYIRN
jgi:hypothetical protein